MIIERLGIIITDSRTHKEIHGLRGDLILLLLSPFMLLFVIWVKIRGKGSL